MKRARQSGCLALGRSCSSAGSSGCRRRQLPVRKARTPRAPLHCLQPLAPAARMQGTALRRLRSARLISDRADESIKPRGSSASNARTHAPRHLRWNSLAVMERAALREGRRSTGSDRRWSAARRTAVTHTRGNGREERPSGVRGAWRSQRAPPPLGKGAY